MDIQKKGEEDVSVYKVDWGEATDQSTSYVVVESIADLTDQDPADLKPLWDSVDTDALDLFVSRASESSTPFQLTFQYQGYSVKVGNRGIQFIPTEETS